RAPGPPARPLTSCPACRAPASYSPAVPHAVGPWESGAHARPRASAFDRRRRRAARLEPVRSTPAPPRAGCRNHAEPAAVVARCSDERHALRSPVGLLCWAALKPLRSRLALNEPVEPPLGRAAAVRFRRTALAQPPLEA